MLEIQFATLIGQHYNISLENNNIVYTHKLLNSSFARYSYNYVMCAYLFLTVKRGYHKLSLKVHPDRVGEDEKEKATLKFQTLGKLYSILSDKEKKAIYDESGRMHF